MDRNSAITIFAAPKTHPPHKSTACVSLHFSQHARSMLWCCTAMRRWNREADLPTARWTRTFWNPLRGPTKPLLTLRFRSTSTRFISAGYDCVIRCLLMFLFYHCFLCLCPIILLVVAQTQVHIPASPSQSPLPFLALSLTARQLLPV